MKRYVIYAMLTVFAVLAAALAAGAQQNLVSNTKHNLSFSGPGTIKASSSGATQICVFCHTPHSARADAPLWNRSMSAASYASKLYTSDVLGVGGLNYPAAEDPSNQTAQGYSVHVKTRICLSCHDGTIALGNLVNLPFGFTSDIPMNTPGTVDVAGAMPHEVPGYIGLDLRDDHPVAIKYLSGSPDPELKATSLKLYSPDNGANNYIECTTCHDPHDDTNGDFLVMSNKNSALCTNCHDKTGYFNSTSIHYSSTAAYDPTGTGSLGTTVGGGGVQNGVLCMGCHMPHKAGMPATNTPLSALPNPNLDSLPKLGYYLLTYQEEQSCFNDTTRWGQTLVSACHGNSATAQSKNIEALVTGQTSAHDVGNYRGIHSATEAQSAGWLSSTNWHVQCADCHNPHTAGGTSHTSPVTPAATPLTASSPLYGVGGVDVSFPASNWGAPTALAYTYRKGIGVTDNTSVGVDQEYKICFKCHTAYAWNGTIAPTSTSLGGPMTDQAQEFNPNNQSYHPVAAANTINSQGSTGLTGGWSSGGTQTMYCSDCHTKNGGGTPKGAHGSSNYFILAGPFADSYGTAGGTHQDAADGANGLCFQCHLMSVYSNATNHVVVSATDTGFRDGNGYNLHNQHRYDAATVANARAYRCVNCHVRVAHGWKRKALIVLQGDGIGINGAPYEAGGGNTGLIVSSTFPAPGAYTQSSCGSSQTSNGVTGCHP